MLSKSPDDVDRISEEVHYSLDGQIKMTEDPIVSRSPTLVPSPV
jgi:hypothetical protein